jgi:hypothetical protein
LTARQIARANPQGPERPKRNARREAKSGGTKTASQYAAALQHCRARASHAPGRRDNLAPGETWGHTQSYSTDEQGQETKRIGVMNRIKGDEFIAGGKRASPIDE